MGKIGFIGFGNMAQALVNGLIGAGFCQGTDVMVSDVVEKAVPAGVLWAGNNVEVARFADVLVLAVKPQQYEEVIQEIKQVLRPEMVVVSIAAGLTIKTLEGYLGKGIKLMRTMPNTPVGIGQGMTALMPNGLVSKDEVAWISQMFDAVGRSCVVDEGLIEGVIVTSGSSPAYVYMMIEAMIKGGMAQGMSRELATTFVTEAMIGAAMMVKETGIAPDVLCDAVCSPNGTTIEAVNHLRRHDFEGLVMDGMAACAKRSKEMALTSN